MSKDFESWCTKQLIKLTGSSDSTPLLHYLMTVDSQSEITEYLKSYLGDKEGVDEFATGFLRHKEFESKKAKVVVTKSSRKMERSGGDSGSQAGDEPPVLSSAYGSFGALLSASPPPSSKDEDEKKKRRRKPKKKV